MSNCKLTEASMQFLREYTFPMGEGIRVKDMIAKGERGEYPRDVASEMDRFLLKRDFRSCERVYVNFLQSSAVRVTRAEPVVCQIAPMQLAPPGLGKTVPAAAIRVSPKEPLGVEKVASKEPLGVEKVASKPYAAPVHTPSMASWVRFVWRKCTPINVLSVLGGVGLVVLLGFVLAHIPYADCSAAIGGFFSRPPLIEVKGGGESLVVTDGELFAFIKGMPVIQGFATRMEQTNAFYQRVSHLLTGTTGDGGVVKDLSDTKQTCSEILKEISETRAACNATTRLFREIRGHTKMISTVALSNIRRRIRLDSKHRNVSVLPPATPVRTLMTSVSDVVIRESQMINQAQTLKEFDNELNKVRLAAAQDKAYLQNCYESEKQERLTNVSALVSQRQSDMDDFATWKKANDARIKELEDNQLDWVQGLLAGVVIGALSVTLVVVVSNPVVLVTLARGGGFGSFIASPIVWFLNYFGVDGVVDAVALGAENAAAAAASAAEAAASATNAQTAVATAIKFLQGTARAAGRAGVGAAAQM